MSIWKPAKTIASYEPPFDDSNQEKAPQKHILPVGVTLVKEINIFDKKAEERNGEFKLKHKQQKCKPCSIAIIQNVT